MDTLVEDGAERKAALEELEDIDEDAKEDPHEDEDGFSMGPDLNDHNQDEALPVNPDDPPWEREREQLADQRVREERKRQALQPTSPAIDYGDFSGNRHQGFLVRVRPGDAATSLAKHNACQNQMASHVITSPMQIEALAHLTALVTNRKDRNDKSCMWNICLCIPVSADTKTLADGMLYKTPSSQAPVSKPLRAAYFWLMTLFLAAPKLTAAAEVMPNITMRVIPQNSQAKKLEGITLLCFNSVWKATRLSAFDPAQKMTQAILEEAEVATSPVKNLTKKCYDTVMHCINSRLACMRDVALLYLDLTEYLLKPRRLTEGTFPAVQCQLLRSAMCTDVLLRMEIINNFHGIFHGPDAPPVLRMIKENGRSIVINVPKEETAVDMGDGVVFYPYRDMMPHTDEQIDTRGSVDPVMDGLMYLALNMDSQNEAPNSAALAARSLSGETANAIRTLLFASRLRGSGRYKDLSDDQEFINRIFHPRNVETHMHRLLNPLNVMEVNQHPVYRSFFMQRHDDINPVGEPLLNSEIRRMAQQQDMAEQDIMIYAAPCLVIDTEKFNDLVTVNCGAEPLIDRSVFSEQMRSTVGRPWSYLSLLFSLDPGVVNNALVLMHCSLCLRNITSPKPVVMALEASAAEFSKTADAGQATMTFVREIRTSDQRFTTGGGLSPPNPWPKNSYSFNMYGRELIVTANLINSMKDVLAMMRLAPHQVIRSDGNGGALALTASLTRTQVDFCVNRYNGANESAAVDLRHTVMSNIHSALLEGDSLARVRFNNEESAVNALRSFYHRKRQEVMMENHIPLLVRLAKTSGPGSGPSRVNARPQACGGVWGGDASGFTNMTTTGLGPMQEFMAQMAHELHQQVYISHLAPFLTVYILPVVFTTILDTAEQFNGIFLGDSTVGKTLYLEVLEKIMSPLGLMSIIHKATDASFYTGWDDCRHRIIALNECSPDFISNGENAANKAGNKASAAANETSVQATLLNSMEHSYMKNTLKVASSKKDNARVVNFKTKTQITNTQHAWLLTRNFPVSGLAQAMITRTFVIHLQKLPKPAKFAELRRVESCAFVPALQDLIHSLWTHDKLVCTRRLLPAVDVSMVEPVLTKVFDLQLAYARKMGCNPIFHVSGPRGGGKFATSRYIKQTLTHMSALCQARLFLTLRHTLAPVLAPLKSWTPSLTHALVGLCSVANIEDAVTASALFCNVDLTCDISMLTHHSEVLLDDVVQAYLYVIHWAAVRATYKQPREAPFPILTPARRTEPLHVDLKDPLHDLIKLSIICQLRRVSLNTLKSPKYCWIIHLALHWYQSRAFRALQGVVIQSDSEPCFAVKEGTRFSKWAPKGKALSMGLFVLVQEALDSLSTLWKDCQRTPLSQMSQDAQIRHQEVQAARLHRSESWTEENVPQVPDPGDDDDDDDDDDDYEQALLREMEEEEQRREQRRKRVAVSARRKAPAHPVASSNARERPVAVPASSSAAGPVVASASTSALAASGHTVLHFGVYLKLLRPPTSQPLVVPYLNAGFLMPSAMVCSKALLTDNAHLYDYYSGESWRKPEAQTFLRHFDVEEFWSECARDVEHDLKLDGSQEPPPSEAKTRVQEPAQAQAPEPSTTQSAAASSSRVTYNKGLGAQVVSADEPGAQDQNPRQENFPVYRAPAAGQGKNKTLLTPEEACTALDHAVLGHMNALQLLKASRINLTSVKGSVRHAVIRAGTLQLQGEAPLSMAWKEVRYRVQKGDKELPNIFDRDVKLMTVSIGDSFVTTVLRRVESREGDNYVDAGVALRENIIGCMRQYEPMGLNAHMRNFRSDVTRSVVDRGGQPSLLKAAFAVRQSAFPLLSATVAEGLNEVAMEYWQSMGCSQEELPEVCGTFINDLIEALLCDPRPWLKKYQYLDHSKLMPYPVNLEALNGKTRVIKPKAGASLLDLNSMSIPVGRSRAPSRQSLSNLYTQERTKAVRVSLKRSRVQMSAFSQAAEERRRGGNDNDDDGSVDVA